MKEIGGYFGLEELPGREYYPGLVAVNTARSALLYVLKARKIRKLYLPYLLCDSVSGLCGREGYPYEYYHIGADLLPRFDKAPGADEYLYVVNYYGQLDDAGIRALKEEYGNIILDNVQAFFQPPPDGIDTLYSCRKFFGVPDGAYLSTDARLERPLPRDVSGGRMKHLLGRFEGAASDYYADFGTNESALAALELRAMSRLTRNILGAIDYRAAKARREENFAYLHERLGEKNRLRPVSPAGPFAYPFYCENGLALKKRLAAEKIYVPTLWPNVLALDGTLEKDCAANILPLPCDQRYGTAEMEKIAARILEE